MGITFHNCGNVMAESVHDITFGVEIVMEDLGILFAKMFIVDVHPSV